MKRIISFALAVALLLCFVPAISVEVKATSGALGDHLTWSLVNGTLTISGTGAMPDKTAMTFNSDWYEQRLEIKKVVIQEGVTHIGDWAFFQCENMTSVSIPSTVKSIGNSAFNRCVSLTTVTIPHGVTTIGEGAFRDCESISRISIPDSVVSIGPQAFFCCNNLVYKKYNNALYIGNSSNPYVVLMDGSASVTTIASTTRIIYHYAFGGSGSPLNLIIPDSVRQIGVDAFKNCYNMESVTIGNGVQEICTRAFIDCESLTSVTIGSSVTKIGEQAFSGCSSLTSLMIPDNVVAIDTGAFSGCSSLTSVKMGEGVTTIGFGAFSGCTSLSDVSMGSNVVNIASSAFNSCQNLNYNIYDGAQYLGNKDNSYLVLMKASAETTSIAEGTYYIFYKAFANQQNITSITIPDSVVILGDHAFEACNNLKNVTIGKGITEISEYAFANCSSLESLVIPDTVTTISLRAFQYCSSLKTVDTGNGVREIETEVFHNCENLEHVRLGNSVTEIGTHAFRQCTNLASIVLPANEVHIEADVFSSTPNFNTIFFRGTEQQKENFYEQLTGVTWHYEVTDVQVEDKTVYLCGKCDQHYYLDGTQVQGAWHQDVVDGEEVSVYYETVEKALSAATGGTVRLATDARVDTAILKPGVTLDLNGFTLTADAMIVVNGATVLDGGASCTGGGLLKIAKENLLFGKNNGQGIIPVWNGADGYIFTKVIFQQMARPAGTGAAQYIFLPAFSNKEAAELMADGGADNDVTIKVCMTWADGQSKQFYTYSDDFVAQVFDGTDRYAFDLQVTGIAGIADMTASPVVATDCGVQATTAGVAVVSG